MYSEGRKEWNLIKAEESMRESYFTIRINIQTVAQRLLNYLINTNITRPSQMAGLKI